LGDNTPLVIRRTAVCSFYGIEKASMIRKNIDAMVKNEKGALAIIGL
jgi:hypothetical protein